MHATDVLVYTSFTPKFYSHNPRPRLPDDDARHRLARSEATLKRILYVCIIWLQSDNFTQTLF